MQYKSYVSAHSEQLSKAAGSRWEACTAGSFLEMHPKIHKQKMDAGLYHTASASASICFIRWIGCYFCSASRFLSRRTFLKYSSMSTVISRIFRI